MVLINFFFWMIQKREDCLSSHTPYPLYLSPSFSAYLALLFLSHTLSVCISLSFSISHYLSFYLEHYSSNYLFPSHVSTISLELISKIGCFCIFPLNFVLWSAIFNSIALRRVINLLFDSFNIHRRIDFSLRKRNMKYEIFES